MTEMNGMFCSTRAMRVGPATTKKSMDMGVQLQNPAKVMWGKFMGRLQFRKDPTLHKSFTVKIIRNKLTGQSEGCGFIEFSIRATAERVLQTYNGQMMPNRDQTFWINWAAVGERRGDGSSDYTVFVGDGIRCHGLSITGDISKTLYFSEGGKNCYS